MKKIISAGTALLVMAAVFQSCDRKSCTDVVCSGVYSTCIDGRCYCQAGWEGANCDIASNSKFLGSWRVSETCTTTVGGFPSTANFTASITPTSRPDVITINNFTFTGGFVDANIVDAVTLYILEQNTGAIEVSGGQGFFKVVNTGIELEYNYKIGSTGYSCRAFYTPF